jgi:hypothetical protein
MSDPKREVQKPSLLRKPLVLPAASPSRIERITGGWLAEQLHGVDYGTRTEVVVRAVGRHAAVVRHRYRGAGSFEGASFTDDHRCVMVWEKHGGVWRLVMEQCSFSRK